MTTREFVGALCGTFVAVLVWTIGCTFMWIPNVLVSLIAAPIGAAGALVGMWIARGDDDDEL